MVFQLTSMANDDHFISVELIGVLIDRTPIHAEVWYDENDVLHSNKSINLLINGQVFGIWSGHVLMTPMEIVEYITDTYHHLYTMDGDINFLMEGIFDRRVEWCIEILS